MIKTSLERELSREEFEEVMAHAAALQVFDETRRDKRYDSSLASLTLGERISTSRAYEIAKELEISESYVKRALARYQSTEEMQRDLDRIRAKPGLGVLSSSYKKVLLDSLRDKFPLENFEARDTLKHGFKLFKIPIQKEFGWLKHFHRNKKMLLASIEFSRGGVTLMDVDIYSPLFTTACSGALERLGYVSKVDYKQVYFHYDPNSEETK